MSSLDNGEYIPYLTLSSEVIYSEHNPALFLRSMFPEATDEQIALFTIYTIGKFHDGVLMGLDIAGRDPIGEVEAYQIGVQDGLKREQ